MKKINKKSLWTKNNAFNKAKGSSFPPSYPNEMLVKFFSSKSYSNLTSPLFKDKIKVCELGCFSGNNLRFFIDKDAPKEYIKRWKEFKKKCESGKNKHIVDQIKSYCKLENNKF